MLSFILLFLAVFLIVQGTFGSQDILSDLQKYERQVLGGTLPEGVAVSGHLASLGRLQLAVSLLSLSVLVFPLISLIVALTTYKKYYSGYVSGFFQLIPFLLCLWAKLEANHLISVWRDFITGPGNYYEGVIHNKTIGTYMWMLFFVVVVQFADGAVRTARHKKGKDMPDEPKRSEAETLAHKVIEKMQPQSSGAAEIRQYKELLDMGAITAEEYEAKKKQLLGLPEANSVPAAPVMPRNTGKCPVCGRENVLLESVEVIVAGMARKRAMCAECASRYR